MAFFEWQDAYSVKVPSIDKQHQGIVEFLNRLYTAMQQGRGQDVLDEIMVGLTDYTQYHFDHEIDMLKKVGFEDVGAHIREHERLIAELEKQKVLVKQGGVTAVFGVSEFLKKWLVEHIGGTDMLYSDYVVSKGVT